MTIFAPSEPERVTAWRVEQFQRLGYMEVEARALIGRGVDHHALADLIRAGCERGTALRIVAE